MLDFSIPMPFKISAEGKTDISSTLKNLFSQVRCSVKPSFQKNPAGWSLLNEPPVKGVSLIHEFFNIQS